MTGRWKYLLASLWILVTVALAAWWMVFGLRQVHKLSSLNTTYAQNLARQQRMLFSEGSTFIALLLVGGGALLYLVQREKAQNDQIKQFFATYTHDLKTSLASLRLQAESLQEDLANSQHAKIVTRLVKDTVRLSLQLENSLILANLESKLFVEEISLSKLVVGFREHWPEVKILLSQEVLVHADARAIESVLKNLIHNAILHGQATEVVLKAEPLKGAYIKLTVVDNGTGFRGDPKKLAQLFLRHYSRSGSGVGLYLSQQLLRKMDGNLHFVTNLPQGFAAELKIRGRVS